MASYIVCIRMVRKSPRIFFLFALFLLAWAGFWYSPISSGDVGLPRFIAWSSLVPGSLAFEEASWFSNAFKNKYNIVLHNLFASHEDCVEALFRSGRVDFSMGGLLGSYFAQEGLLSYAEPNAGPQSVRLVLENQTSQLRTLLVRRADDITTVAQLRGKRIPWLKDIPWLREAEPAFNYMILALLRYGGVEPGDVRFVLVSSPENALLALRDGKVDVAFSLSRERVLYAAEAGGFPFRYLSFPANEERWRALHEAAPFFGPVKGTVGAGVSETHPVESVGYAFPVIVAHAGTSRDYVEHFTDALLQTLPGRIALDSKMQGWEVTSLPLDWAVPYHDGSIAVFKRLGVWTEVHQQRNDKLIERQRVLAEAWKVAKSRGLPPADFQKAWYAIRENTLRDAGFAPGFIDFQPDVN